MNHLDLFSGIGGFALAVDTVFPGSTHTFVELDPFCQAVLRKHWPESDIHADIRQFITDTERQRWEGRGRNAPGQHGQFNRAWTDEKPFILTGGFPCQPFSVAGRRKGTADDRYLWPEMFRVIQLHQPTWVIAENVHGLTTWNDGMVLEQVCADLESENYEVQPLIIPACAVNAPHRRDRVWIVAHAVNGRPRGAERPSTTASDCLSEKYWSQDSTTRWDAGSDQDIQSTRQEPERKNNKYPDWQRDWREVALTTCNDSVDDGLPRRMGGLTISRARWRKEALKAYGNAIVPQVAEQIMRGMASEVVNITEGLV